MEQTRSQPEQNLETACRAFLKRSALYLTGGVVTSATLAVLSAHSARAGEEGGGRSDYGRLYPTQDQDGNTIVNCSGGLT
ncbi:MAG: hypothetical protein AB1768_08175 [Pseudomonadota bacterium]|jgi:hypothetical protein